jgi:hypothetical protein
MKQIHDRVVFEPISIEEMNILERKRAMESLTFLTKKRDETAVKARVCANGSTQRASGQTAASEEILITGLIDAKQKRDVMTLDIPNTFKQTEISLDGDKIIMKIRGQLVDILLELCPGVYDDYVIMEGKHKIMYMRMLKAVHGMLISSILYYKKFRKDIELIRFEVNPYNICVANRKVNGKQQTVMWHVDDLKLRVNDNFAQWWEKTYGSDNLGHVKVVRGKKHDYLGMILDSDDEGAMKVDMVYYIKGMLEDFPYPIGPTKATPWTEKLLKVQEDTPKLEEERHSIFHTYVMKSMFLCKRGLNKNLGGQTFMTHTLTTCGND